MSSRYSLRKRQTIVRFAEDNFDSDLEKLLADHERSGIEFRAKRDAKKRKVEEEVDDVDWGYTIPFDSLPALCIERIFSMVDSPQDLYNISFTSKYLMSLITPEVVIRSAVFNNLRKRDVRNRKTLAGVMNLVSNRSIHVPSAHRMLRLLNAKWCERGDQCWGMNLETGKPGMIDPTSIHRPFGLAICDKCVKFGTTNVPYSHFSRFQPGVAFYQWNKVIGPHTDPVTGEIHGPLVQPIQLQQIEGSYRSIEDRKNALKGIVARAHVESGNECPCRYEEKAAAYVAIFESAETEADEYVESLQRQEFEKYQERRECRLAKRLQRVKSIYDTLNSVLEDCPMKDLALECTWRDDDQDCLKFSCTIVDNIMRNIISAPASASDKMVHDAAIRIKEAFQILHDKDFFSYSFLSESCNRFRQGMYDYCTNEATPLKILECTYADSNFLRQVELNQPTRALVRLLNVIRDALPRCFALSAVRPNPESPAAEVGRTEDYRKLAAAVWKKKSSIGPAWSLATIKESYNSCVEEYRTLKKNAKDYLNASETRSFLRRDAPTGHRGGDFTRREALNQVFSPSTTSQYFMTVNERVVPYELLLNRNFSRLRDVHESYYRNPQRYGLRGW